MCVVPPSHGYTATARWLTVVGVPVSQANEILRASYQLYWHTNMNETVHRTISYGLPVELCSHIKAVTPTTYFNPPRMPRAGTMAGAREGLSRHDVSEEKYMPPSFLRWLYNTLGYGPEVAGRNRLGVVGQWPSPVDLALFMKAFCYDG